MAHSRSLRSPLKVSFLPLNDSRTYAPATLLNPRVFLSGAFSLTHLCASFALLFFFCYSLQSLTLTRPFGDVNLPVRKSWPPHKVPLCNTHDVRSFPDAFQVSFFILVSFPLPRPFFRFPTVIWRPEGSISVPARLPGDRLKFWGAGFRAVFPPDLRSPLSPFLIPDFFFRVFLLLYVSSFFYFGEQTPSRSFVRPCFVVFPVTHVMVLPGNYYSVI